MYTVYKEQMSRIVFELDSKPKIRSDFNVIIKNPRHIHGYGGDFSNLIDIDKEVYVVRIVLKLKYGSFIKMP